MQYTVTALKMGELLVDKSSLTSGIGIGEKTKVPVWAAAVEGNGKKYLIDTGIHNKDWVNKNIAPCTQQEDESIIQALKKIGWECSDVDVLINTHLHYDHCGNNSLFPNAQIIIQKTEWENSYNPIEDQKCYYLKELFSNESIQYTDIYFADGEMIVADGIKIIPTPGHCKGHQSVLVNTKEGVVCIAADAVNLFENIRDNILPSILSCSEQVFKSMELIRRTANFILPGHEPKIEKFQNSDFPKIN